MPLDIVEVARSHSRDNLAGVFVKVMEDYEISEKQSMRKWKG